MIINYFLVSLRNILKHRASSVISISSLVFSLSFALVIMIYTHNERSFDNFIPDSQNKYRLTFNIHGDKGINIHAATSPAPYAPFFQAAIPEIKTSLRFMVNRYGSALLINPNGNSIKSEYVAWSDEGILEFFGVPLLKGSGALSDPNSVLISEETALRLYGTIDVLGKVLVYNDSKNFSVSGVFQDLPHNSTVQFDMVAGIEVLEEIMPWYYQNGANWGGYAFHTYFDFVPDIDQTKVGDTFTALYQERFEIDPMDLPSEYMSFGLINVSDIHLHSDMSSEITPPSDLQRILMFELLALVIAAIGWINFMNIQSARGPERLKEIAIRRALGASVASLRLLFLGEYLVINLVSIVLAVLLALFVFPSWMESGLGITLQHMQIGPLPLVILGVGTVLASAYPAVLTAGQSPASSIAQTLKSSLAARVRNVLVSMQFVAALFLLVFTLVIYLQVRHMSRQDLGIEASTLLVIDGPVSEHPDDIQKARYFTERLEELASIESATFSTLAPGKNRGWQGNLPSRDGDNSSFQRVYLSNIFQEFFDILDVDVLAGSIPEGPVREEGLPRVILNRTAAKGYNWTPDEAVGKKVGYSSDAIVSAVVEDFNSVGFQEQLAPMVFIYDHVFFQSTTNDFFIVRVHDGSVLDDIAKIEETYLSLFPNNPFVHEFSDQLYISQYQREVDFNNLFLTFSALAILLSITGLIGLTTYHVIQKRREIGIRKVLGAKRNAVIGLFLSRYLKLIGISAIVAVAPTWWFANNWLNDFAVRIDLHPVVILAPLFLLVTLVMLTVGAIAANAAKVNPVEVLREN